jgi:catechol 2,3-dioxygenase-like lactoylglutathione lyase family enzyme
MAPKASSLILYVEKVEASTAFYSGLFGREPLESHPNFAMFALEGGFLLGLWAGRDADPKPKGAGGGCELTFTCEKDAELDALHAEWSGKGCAILQKPMKKDFGYTFTAADPDGHRLRAMVLA